jgi:hypothetical protein
MDTGLLTPIVQYLVQLVDEDARLVSGACHIEGSNRANQGEGLRG